MIYSLEGKVKEKGSDFIVIKTNHLSYQVFVTDFYLQKIKSGQQIEVYTYLEVRENAMELYGFVDQQEVKYFKYLHSISGIGARSAMNILSLVSISDLEKAIVNEKDYLLTKVSGIGKKTAQRIILELKEKIIKSGTKTLSTSEEDQDDSLVIDALVNMGYSLFYAREALKKIPPEIKGPEKRITQALKYLSKK